MMFAKSILFPGLGIAGTCAIVGLLVSSETPAQANSAIKMTASADSQISYIGSNTCRKCHLPTYRSWSDMKHGKAFDTLKPGEASEVKTKFNLDPNKDYTKDPECLQCHTTGYGKPGGYAIPDPANEKEVKEMSKLENVGCESCHGPGEKYNEVFTDIKKTKRTYTLEELYAVGLEKISEQTCTQCHNDKSPTHDPEKPFDFEKMKETGVHEHVKLTQRANP